MLVVPSCPETRGRQLPVQLKESAADDGHSPARYRNDTCGEMRTTWQFTVRKGDRFGPGQA